MTGSFKFNAVYSNNISNSLNNWYFIYNNDLYIMACYQRKNCWSNNKKKKKSLNVYTKKEIIMAKKFLPSKAINAWQNAYSCACGAQQDVSQWGHKICSWCEEVMEYGVYEDWAPTNPLCWNVKHINPKSQGGTNKPENLIAVHKACNR